TTNINRFLLEFEARTTVERIGKSPITPVKGISRNFISNFRYEQPRISEGRYYDYPEQSRAYEPYPVQPDPRYPETRPPPDLIPRRHTPDGPRGQYEDPHRQR